MVLRDRARLIIGSIGLGLVLTGLVIFVGQMYRAVESGRLETVAVRQVLDEPFVRHNVPVSWSESLRRTSSALGADAAVDWLLDEFPLPLFLIVVGGIAAWRGLVWEPPASHRR